MLKYLCLLVLAPTVAVAAAQTAAKAPDAKPDYSKEAFVDEEDTTRIAFENDGTSTREASFRLRIQSDAGVQRYSVLTFAYQEAIETIEVVYVRLRKPDGTVIVTPAENILDMPSDITRQAPFYSDLHEKHVAVKGLAVGDVLETQIRWHVTKPLIPGQFWYSFNFSRDFIQLHEEFQISVPRERAVKWKSSAYKPVITEEGGRRIFTWTRSQLEHPPADQEKTEQEKTAYNTARGKLPPPDIQLSSFQNWEEIGAWYGGLQQERVKPSPEIRAKAAELTRNAADDNAKLHAIYNYVSTQFRYIGVAFGIGRYQPHSAADVLANQYGDCKDKHTLLASLLDAAGIKAYPALINSSSDLDPDVPSPAQFNHVITAVPQGKDFLWLDSTAEVAPFGYLMSVLLDKDALVMPTDKASSLVRTPANPVAPALETFAIAAKLDDSGVLEGTVHRSLTGDDAEIIFRSAFRRTPSSQWKDLMQRISYGSGFSGDVSDATVSSPDKTDEAFRCSYHYVRKDFPEWSKHQRISSPLPPFLSFSDDDETAHPVVLGTVGEIRYVSRVELPKGYSPQLPGRVNLHENFADYRATYSFSNGFLLTQRKLVVRVRELPAADYQRYSRFATAVANDCQTFVVLFVRKSPQTPLDAATSNLPMSPNGDAMLAFDEALASMRKKDMPGAMTSLERAVQADTKFVRAWMLLAALDEVSGKRDASLGILRKARAANPDEDAIPIMMIAALEDMKKYEDALVISQELASAAPDDLDVLANLAAVFAALKRYGEEAGVIESSLQILPEEPGLELELGDAYLNAGDEVKALAVFQKTLDLTSDPAYLNSVSYDLADRNKQLPLAFQYAEKAVKEEEEASAKVTLADLKVDDLAHTVNLSAYWDTLGWVHFRMGNYEKAEKYLNAAWLLSQDSTEADHMAQAYKMLHKSAWLPPDSSAIRTTKLPRLAPGTASAELFLTFGRDSKGSGARVEDAKFIGGEENLRSSVDVLRKIEFKFPFPDDGPSRLVRRGILSCYPVTGCTFVLYNISDVHSVY